MAIDVLEVDEVVPKKTDNLILPYARMGKVLPMQPSKFLEIAPDINQLTGGSIDGSI